MDVKAIQRYEYWWTEDGACSGPDCEGKWVKYSDHITALSDTEKLVKELAEELKWFYHVVHQSEEY